MAKNRKPKVPKVYVDKKGRRYIKVGKKKVFIDKDITDDELLKFLLKSMLIKQLMPTRRRRTARKPQQRNYAEQGLTSVIQAQTERQKQINDDIKAQEKRSEATKKAQEKLKRNQLLIEDKTGKAPPMIKNDEAGEAQGEFFTREFIAKAQGEFARLNEELKKVEHERRIFKMDKDELSKEQAVTRKEKEALQRDKDKLQDRIDENARREAEIRQKLKRMTRVKDKLIESRAWTLMEPDFPTKTVNKLLKEAGYSTTQTKDWNVDKKRKTLVEKGIIHIKKYIKKAEEEIDNLEKEFKAEEAVAPLSPRSRTVKASETRRKPKEADEAEEAEDEEIKQAVLEQEKRDKEDEPHGSTIIVDDIEIPPEGLSTTNYGSEQPFETEMRALLDKGEITQQAFDFAMEKHRKESQQGTGSRGLYDTELDVMMKKIPSYLGTIASDEIRSQIIPKVRKQSRGSFIMNLDPSDKSGSHWISVVFDARPNGSNSIEYFDSFGRAPSKAFLRDLKLLAEKLDAQNYLQLKINRIQKQDNSTETCGYHSAKFIFDRMRNRSFQQATGFEDRIIDASKKGEAEINKFKKQYGGFSYLPSFGAGIIDSLKEGWRRLKNFFLGINEMSPTLKNFMNSNDANSPIQQIEVSRAPIQSVIETIMNAVSLGQLEQNKKTYNFDQIYHLVISFMVNGKWYSFDRRPRVTMVQGKLSQINGIDKSKLQGRVISLQGKQITIAEMFKNAIEKIGEQRLFSYTGSENNCQRFVVDMLRSSNLLTSADQEWILQDTSKLLQNTGILPAVADAVTGISHRFEGLFGGKKSKIQAVLFDGRYWEQDDARKWLRQHKLKPIKPVHITEHYMRYRILTPHKNKQYRTKKLDNHVTLIIEI